MAIAEQQRLSLLSSLVEDVAGVPADDVQPDQVLIDDLGLDSLALVAVVFAIEESTGAQIGTGSLRRRAQLLHYRRDLTIVPVRGNVDTRVKKLDQGEYDALVMAAAGLKRIGREERIAEYISNDVCLGAAGQGALGLESRENDSILEELSFLHDPVTFAEVTAERSFLSRLGGGCHVPVGARARRREASNP